MSAHINQEDKGIENQQEESNVCQKHSKGSCAEMQIRTQEKQQSKGLEAESQVRTSGRHVMEGTVQQSTK